MIKTVLPAALALLAWTASACHGAEAAGPVLQTLEVQESFGVDHPMQIIDFDLEARAVPSAVHLLDDAGLPVAFQLLDGGRKLAVKADLPAHHSRRWRLMRGAGPRVLPSESVVIR